MHLVTCSAFAIAISTLKDSFSVASRIDICMIAHLNGDAKKKPLKINWLGCRLFSFSV